MEKPINNKEALLSLLTWNMNAARIIDRKLNQVIDKFYKDSDSSIFDNLDVCKEQLNQVIADYIFGNFDKLIVTSNEKVYGLQGENRDLLFDTEGLDVYVKLIP